MADNSNIKDAADAVKGIVEAVPVYQDALQPAAKEIGKALQTVTKTVHIALAPVSALVWGYEKIADFVTIRVSELLKDVPPEKIATPSASVAGPAIEALRFAGEQPPLREMYAKLLASSMNVETAAGAHPAFVEIIKQLNQDEARILSRLAGERYRPQPVVTLSIIMEPPEFEVTGNLTITRNVSLLGKQAKCVHIKLCASYLDNLCRLGLTKISDGGLAAPNAYDKIHKLKIVREHLERTRPGTRSIIMKQALRFTDLGQQFIEACVLDTSPAMPNNSFNPTPR